LPGEAFLDDDDTVEAVLGEIGQSEAAAVEKAFNDILAVQQRRARLEVLP
jgi:hypothetical protein